MTQTPVSFLDKMPQADRERAIKRAEKRLERNKTRKGVEVSPEFFQLCEMGYYYGWDALMAVRRGFTTYIDNKYDEDGNIIGVQAIKEPLTSVEAEVILEGARKVWYSKLIEQAHAGVISNTFNHSSKSFDDAIKPFKEKAD